MNAEQFDQYGMFIGAVLATVGAALIITIAVAIVIDVIKGLNK